MPVLQLLDEDANVAAAIVNTGCLMEQRNKCAADSSLLAAAADSSLLAAAGAALHASTCCANLARQHGGWAKYSYVQEALVCG